LWLVTLPAQSYAFGVIPSEVEEPLNGRLTNDSKRFLRFCRNYRIPFRTNGVTAGQYPVYAARRSSRLRLAAFRQSAKSREVHRRCFPQRRDL
jgi:hypothetical protein